MATDSLGNVQEYSVTELSSAVKRSIEDGFGFVRVRGELGRVSRPASGHLYFDLKDEKSVLAGVMWKGMASRVKIDPEQGMEVVATGRMTTFAGQSRYQLVVDSLEPAGVGALMALLEERKKKFAAEGLFAQERKRALPFLPRVIGVVTSPSGAVIRDILHRLRDRFPRHVLVWPTLVQGKGAEIKIAEAISGFNALPEGGDIPRPDILIVARGGGSLEDLWCFNEEAVVRAAASSAIPLISAVGHETDTTLIDYVSDRRAPTPTAAAEMAVPVRSEIHSELLNKQRRLTGGLQRLVDTRAAGLLAAARGLGRPEDILGIAGQRLDRAGDRLEAGLRTRLDFARNRYGSVGSKLSPNMLAARFQSGAARVDAVWARGGVGLTRAIDKRANRVASAARVLGVVSYQSVLDRGFALVRGPGGDLVRRAGDAPTQGEGSAQFADGEISISFGAKLGAQTDGGPARQGTKPAQSAPISDKKSVDKKKKSRPPAGQQKGLFD